MNTIFPIRQYRDFWDVPRMFLVDSDGRSMLFDCPFDEEREDFSDQYRIHLMPTLVDRELEGSWAELPKRAIRSLGTVPVASVQFDKTKRAFVEARLINSLLARIQIPTMPAEPADVRS